jgi:hypothetical protein
LRGEGGARARTCNPLPGGFGHQSSSTTTRVRGAFAGLGQIGAGNTRSTEWANPVRRVPGNMACGCVPCDETLLGARTAGGTPIDVRLPYGGAAGPDGSGKLSLRLSAFCFRFFLSVPFVILGLDPGIHAAVKLPSAYH